MEGRQNVEDERPDHSQNVSGQINYFLEIPLEISPLVVSFLYRHEAAKLGEVCRFFYKVSRDPAKPFLPHGRLPLAPPNYAKEAEPVTFDFENHNEVSGKTILSNNMIAFIFRNGKIHIVSLIGFDSAETVKDQIQFESARPLPATSIYTFLAEVSGKLVVGANNSDVFKVFELDPLNPDPTRVLRLIKTVNTTFINTWDLDFGHLIPCMGINLWLFVQTC